MDEFNLDEREILSKLALIEKHLDGFNYNFYEVSSDFHPNDIISVQKEASKMMKFVGLNHHVACITYTNTDKGTGGNIDLDNSDNVFIEINQCYKYDTDKTLAVMAHEICHKVLYVHHLFFPNNTIENELLTDLSTVYVGFGKLSLNGCFNESYSKNKVWKDNHWVDVTTTRKEYVGYLSLRQFALAYSIVCSYYGIPSEKRLSGLNNLSSKEVKSLALLTHTPYNLEDIRQKLKNVQKQPAELARCIVLMESITSELKKRIQEDHKRFNDDFVLPYTRCNNTDPIEKQIIVAELFSKYIDLDRKKKETIGQLQSFIEDYNTNHIISNSILLDIECPCCGYKKQKALKEQKEIFIKCPNCGYMFLWNANELKDPPKTQNENKTSMFDKLKKKMRILFRKKDKVFISMAD